MRALAGILAHGGAAGAAAEALFVLVPIGIFAVLSRISKRRRDQEVAEAAEGDPETEITAP